MISLTAEPRSELKKTAQKFAGSEKMPAIVYGAKQAATPITVPLRDFQRILRKEGESSVIELTGLGQTLQVLIHDIDRDPVTTTPRHADFYAIEKGAKVEVSVPLEFIGESPAVKLGGNLVKVLHEVTVEADAAHLPQHIEVNIATLENMGDQVHASDLKMPSGVTLITEGEEVVALIQEVEEEQETTEAAPDMASIEVEKKGKGEEESEPAE